MRRRTNSSINALAVLLLVTTGLQPACNDDDGKGESESGDTGGKPAGISGTWTGWWFSGSISGAMTVQITDSGGQLSGSMTWGASICFSEGPVEGTNQGGTIQFSATSGENSEVVFNGGVDETGKTMTGTFEFIQGSCSSTSGDNEKGTFDIDFTGNVPTGDTGT